jgi:hypothetical protein
LGLLSKRRSRTALDHRHRFDIPGRFIRTERVAQPLNDLDLSGAPSSRFEQAWGF